MNENYPSASEVIRNIADLKVPYETLDERGKFRLVQIAPPYFAGYELWIVNEKGFLWEPAKDLEAALNYLDSDEALEYQAS